jgi:hypothetical protein
MSNNRLITLSPDTYSNAQSNYYPIVAGLTEQTSYGPITSGGWQTVDRPKQVAATQWFDRAPYKMEIEIILDNTVTNAQQGYQYSNSKYVNANPNLNGVGSNFAAGGPHVSSFYGSSVEKDCLQLELWMEKVPGMLEPPSIRVSGPIPGTQRTYIVYSLDFGEAIRDFETGNRIQQNVKVTLYEYNPPFANASNKSKYSPAGSWVQNSINQTNGAQFQTYIIKINDTIGSIAGSRGAGYAQQILEVNGIRDPSLIAYMAGETIILP